MDYFCILLTLLLTSSTLSFFQHHDVSNDTFVSAKRHTVVSPKRKGRTPARRINFKRISYDKRPHCDGTIIGDISKGSYIEKCTLLHFASQVILLNLLI